ncbi:MAG TPA: UDP-N-acetylmuramoyl-tripeptide--D-alanyl-D-alanine ligase [Syntrophales bacterium]|nr:UDP-N-acetylmuramoyl-tripeptide--D-alanyl-D-alanine ligase [Syntrophales bacterium]HQB31318.1 UDP-N-acetylmuramoyl-tripeptide--D-alanyl-D-alanine ligase [Syntrophales bacterium]HQN76849.1 UDP-N-acetylmuramoyl-tripeptide--D-alanyl-D-alanine ligase [Syntrophales bacterium]HQQ26671.1 UDP-N-acetylmuramoyl-tripeptide--D-alanyl-D-alanine ligase [Syntrophales bacterium]
MNDSLPSFTAAEILRATGGTLAAGNGEASSFGISTDTRRIGRGNLFIALTGERFDGHGFLRKALEKGAAGLLVKTGKALPGTGPGEEKFFAVSVADTLRALGDLARFWRDRFPVPVIAVTGSSGKTTTKDMIGTILSRGKKVLVTPGNLNNLVGVPLVLFSLRDGHEVVVVEMGTNRPGEIERLAWIARPTIGLVTNIGRAHLEGLGSLDGIREEKGALFRGVDPEGTLVVNGDDGEVRKAAEGWKGKTVSFGTGAGAFVRAEGVRPGGDGGVEFTLFIGSFHGDVRLSLFGLPGVYNALAAAACCHAAGTAGPDILEGLGAVRPAPGRMSVELLSCGARLVDDTYNANPDSVAAAVETLAALRGGGRVHVVFGDMLELGGASADLHRETGRRMGALGIDTLFVRGEMARHAAAGAGEAGKDRIRIVAAEDPGEVAGILREILRKGDWVLVKGSRGMAMERFADAIRGAFGTDPEKRTGTEGSRL